MDEPTQDYEAPAVEDVDVSEGPATATAGGTPTPIIG